MISVAIRKAFNDICVCVLDFNMQRTYRQARIHQRICIEEETGPILIRGADCLPVSFLLLYSSSQAQVCVGRDWVLSDHSNSCCVLALALMRAHPQKGKHAATRLRSTP